MLTIDNVKTIIAHRAVYAAMHRILVLGPTQIVPPSPTWVFDGAERPTSPFTLLHHCVKLAVAEAIVNGPDREGLLALLMASEGNPAEEVGNIAEDYAVEMQFGPEGVKSYREIVSYTQSAKVV